MNWCSKKRAIEKDKPITKINFGTKLIAKKAIIPQNRTIQ